MNVLTAALLLQTPAAPVQAPRIAMGVRPVAMAASPTGSQAVLTLEDGSVRILEASTRATVRNLDKHPQPAYAVDWSQDGAWIATGDESARIWLHDARTGKRIREYRTHTRGIQKLSFNPTRTLLASTGKDDFIKVYDLMSPRPKEAVNIPGNGANFYGADFSPRLGTTISTGILGPGARLYDARSGKVSGFLSDPTGQGAFDADYNPAGTRVATAMRDGSVILWDPLQQKKVATLRGHKDFVMDVAFSPNGRLLASGSVDATVRVWNTLTNTTVATITGQSYVGSPVVFTSDGRFLLTVNDAGFLQVNPLNPPQPAVAPKKR